jgi:hypothetical protein
MAERFGWTLPEIDALTWAEMVEFFQVEDGRAKARAK